MFNLDLSVNAVEMCPRGDFRVVRVFEEYKSDKRHEPRYYMKQILIDYQGMLLTNRYIEIVYLRKFLKLFCSKHLVTNEPNEFFEITTRKNKNKQELALRCKFDKERVIYRAEADCMLDVLNSAMVGYSDKYFHYGYNSIEALAYAEELEANKIPRLNKSSRDYLQDTAANFFLVEAKSHD